MRSGGSPTRWKGFARGARLSAQLLAFSRKQPLEPKVVRVGRLIAGLDDMLRRSLGEAVEIEVVVAGGLWDTLIDPAQLENALLNLAINARDAMEEQGRLTIEAGNATLDDEQASRHGEVAPGQYVTVAVTDTGAGMTPEVMEQAFEPFFSTKPEGKGTGLGLSMVYGFVKQSGGHVRITSAPGRGTTVRLFLPRTVEAEEPAPAVEPGPVRGGTETILVAEDNEGVRDTVVAMLVELGYRVLKVRDAASALNLLDSGVRIDLLFTDVVMPGPMRGPELARRARERIPGLAVLFTPATPRTRSCRAGGSIPTSSCYPSRTRPRRWPGSCARCWPRARVPAAGSPVPATGMSRRRAPGRVRCSSCW